MYRPKSKANAKLCLIIMAPRIPITDSGTARFIHHATAHTTVQARNTRQNRPIHLISAKNSPAQLMPMALAQPEKP